MLLISQFQGAVEVVATTTGESSHHYLLMGYRLVAEGAGAKFLGQVPTNLLQTRWGVVAGEVEGVVEIEGAEERP
jgi:hypothetical protein